MEYLVTMTTHVPDGTPAEAVDDVRARAAAGHASSRRRGTCCGCGARCCGPARRP